MDKDVIFIGGLWSKDIEHQIIERSKGVVQIAANNLQTALIEGFDSILDYPVTIISGLFIGAFPKRYRDLFIKERSFNHATFENHKDYYVGFINLPVYKHISKYIHSKKYIDKCCGSVDGTKYLVGYSMTQSVVNELCYAKNKYPSIITCLVVPDLPEYMNFGPDRGAMFRFLKNRSTSNLYRKIKNIDSFVLLTDHMYNRLNVDKPYIVVEGVSNNISLYKNNYLDDGIKRIVYTGTLSKAYGICDLVDAFCEQDGDDLRLIICGSGDGQNYVEEMAMVDKRIDYRGNVSSEEARSIQSSAYLLVNPRKPEGEYTKYSFPSKTIEYMSSGRPVLMYKLAGVPNEYDEYLYYINDNLSDSLKVILSFDSHDLNEKGKSARNFVFNNKSNEVQASKIMSMMLNLNNV